jgi:hypothetical protein
MSDAHIAWYRTDVRKGKRDITVMTCVGWKPPPNATTVVKTERVSGGGQSVFFADANETYVAAILSAADRILARAKADVEALGLTLHPVVSKRDDDLLKWISRPQDYFRQNQGYVNFMWLQVIVPYGKGQKVLAKKVAAKLAEYSSEFAVLGMVVEAAFSDEST